MDGDQKGYQQSVVTSKGATETQITKTSKNYQAAKETNATKGRKSPEASNVNEIRIGLYI